MSPVNPETVRLMEAVERWATWIRPRQYTAGLSPEQRETFRAKLLDMAIGFAEALEIDALLSAAGEEAPLAEQANAAQAAFEARLEEEV